MLTKKEKIELRERAYKLAHELKGISGTSSSNVLAEEIYRFLSRDLDDDPLRLDEPSPIDWDRPQLLKCAYQDTVVRSTGHHTHGQFEAVWVSSLVDWEYNTDSEMWDKDEFSEMWDKDEFVYHGEIPATRNREKDRLPGESDDDWIERVVGRKRGFSPQKSPPISDQLANLLYGHQGEILLRRKTWSFDNAVRCHGHDAIESIINAGYHEEQLLEDDWEAVEEKISETPEENITGLGFHEAVSRLNHGSSVSICREGRRHGIRVNDNGEALFGVGGFLMLREDVFATDWQIIKE